MRHPPRCTSQREVRSQARPRSCLFGVVAGAAYQSYGMSSVRYSADPGDVTSGNARQPLELRTIVSFVELPDKALVEAVKPAPRLLPTFPEVPPPPKPNAPARAGWAHTLWIV